MHTQKRHVRGASGLWGTRRHRPQAPHMHGSRKGDSDRWPLFCPESGVTRHAHGSITHAQHRDSTSKWRPLDNSQERPHRTAEMTQQRPWPSRPTLSDSHPPAGLMPTHTSLARRGGHVIRNQAFKPQTHTAKRDALQHSRRKRHKPKEHGGRYDRRDGARAWT